MKHFFYLLLTLCVLAGGVSAAQAQQSNPQTVTYSGKQYYKYVVQPKETIYALTRRFDVSEEELKAMNPFLSDGLKIGQTLTIPVRKQVEAVEIQTTETAHQERPSEANDKTISETNNEKPSESSEAEEKPYTPKFIYYSVQDRRENLNDIAAEHDVSVDALRSLNPNIPEVLKRGSIVLVPLTDLTEEEDLAEQEMPQDSLPAAETMPHSDQPSVALFLPFMIGDTSGIPVERYVEFYEGLLLAADTLRNMGLSMNIYTYDIGNTPEDLQKVITGNDFSGIDFIIAAAGREQMPYLSAWAKRQQKTLILPFSSRIQETAENPYIYQINPPNNLIYKQLLEIDTAVFSNKNILILRTTHEELDERVQLFRALKTRMDDMHIPYREVSEYNEYYQDTLTKYVSLHKENLIIPAPFSLTESNRIISLVGAIANANRAAKISMWGYSEWIALSKNNLPQLHALNTCIYGNYYADFQRKDVRDFQIKYSCVFGKDLLNTFPRYAMMAYDIMVYFSSLYSGQDFAIAPLQHTLNFNRNDETGGLYNSSVYIIHYLPNRSISATLLP